MHTHAQTQIIHILKKSRNIANCPLPQNSTALAGVKLGQVCLDPTAGGTDIL